MSGIKDLVINPKWGSCSEVSFTAYKKINGIENPSYSLLHKSILLHIDGFGYFVIQGYEESYEDSNSNKSITAYSVEYLLNNKPVNLVFITTAGDINTTDSTTTITSNYFFYREEQPEKSLLHQLIAIAPQWEIGYVSDSLKNKSRSFEQTDNGLYGFLTNDVAQSYEALFVFDNEGYVINAYDTTEIIKPTNIVLSFDNLLKNATVSELSDDIYTVLNVSGAEGLDILKVNPNGTNKLYCLDYYTGVLDKDSDNYYENYNRWIKDNALKRKILEWEKNCREAIYDTSPESYAHWTDLYIKFNAALISAQAELKSMQTYHDIAQKNMSEYSEYSDVDNIVITVQRNSGLDKGLVWHKTYEWYTHDDGRMSRWDIIDDSDLRQNTTDDSYSVTWYQYWTNYTAALEQNIKSLEEWPYGSTEEEQIHAFYSFNESDFEEGGEPNKEYNTTRFWSTTKKADGSTIRKFKKPKGKVYSNIVVNHEFPPKNADKYTISALKTELAFIQSRRDEIFGNLSYSAAFTDEEKEKIEPYLIEGTFSDDSFIVTDSMKIKDYSDKTTKIQVIDASGNISVKTIAELEDTDTIMDDIYEARQLVKAGYEKLDAVSSPSFSFSLESTNFLFIEKFQPFIQQLLSIEKRTGTLFGSVINVMLDDGNWVYPYLQEMSIEYDDPDSFDMSFGNRFRISDSTFTFNELHAPMIGTVSRVGNLLSAVSQPVTNGTISGLSSYTNNPITLTKQTISASTQNSFTIGPYGILGKAHVNTNSVQTLGIDEEQGQSEEFSPEQISISNNKICFTTDYWETTKAIFGKMITETGEEVYGLKADTLIGSFVIGNNLIISNNNDTMTMDENGFIVKNDTMGVRIDPNEENVFNIYKRKVIEETEQQREYEEKTPVLTVTKDGTLTITGGDLVVGDGTSGYMINGQKGTIESVLKDSDGRPLFQLTPDGHLFTSGTTIDGSEILEPSPVVTPTGTNGIVDTQDIEMPSTFMDRLKVIAKAEWYGPYNYVLDRVGKNDNEGWRKIWGYYSSRSLNQILVDFQNAGNPLITRNDINTQFGITNSDVFEKKTITIGEESYTVLCVKSNE